MRRSGGVDQSAVAAVRGLESDAALVELVAELGKSILGEVVGLELERARDQFERAAAGPCAAGDQVAR